MATTHPRYPLTLPEDLKHSWMKEAKNQNVSLATWIVNMVEKARRKQNSDVTFLRYGMWFVTDKGDRNCRELADRHYSRQSVGNKQFCRPGHNLVLRTALADALWVTWSGIRDDGLDAWECTIFRNESGYLSSDMIRWAVRATLKQWGLPPKDGIITYVDAEKVASRNPGFCFKKAGFQLIGKSKKGLLLLQLSQRDIKREYRSII
ncbi:hypothetical protein [Brevibacillus brevis]|uniref:Uncharacterized protein n=1 Tax=Brevibacillus brevis TaxID=1393 RepID=A0ABY9TDZ7_BREBE|nr:hypothetical protein [Brevibacillus brevis]WNC17879.1 hypothetical protein RGB73_30385 [Brevibacillus brevis]